MQSLLVQAVGRLLAGLQGLAGPHDAIDADEFLGSEARRQGQQSVPDDRGRDRTVRLGQDGLAQRRAEAAHLPVQQDLLL
ncbi:hypothetical protein [Methylobacterium mesophilicum]|uniref:hypothetical protein n=1 Tax=Methylobacterium mesophilicum TaxID=39956 RepID=UPI002F34F891